MKSSKRDQQQQAMLKCVNAWEEEERLFFSIDEYLPINPEEWEQVRDMHCQLTSAYIAQQRHSACI
jgi:hypothetical protein